MNPPSELRTAVRRRCLHIGDVTGSPELVRLDKSVEFARARRQIEMSIPVLLL
jgi:hypothetical protein